MDTEGYRHLCATGMLPRKRYVIYFTARSGSSWLTDIVTRTGRLGAPDECFNPNFLTEMARAMQAGSLAQYIDTLQRRRAPGGIFGCEITFYQMKVVFGGPEAFLAAFGRAKPIWLIREDIVQQAVSLYKMETTQVAHRASSDAAARAAAEAQFTYDRAQIRHWLEHLLTKERRTEAMFAAHDMAPLRLSYEVITRLGAPRVVNVLANYLAEPAIDLAEVPSAHGKLGTSRNLAFATRFREEEAAYMAEVKAIRSPWLRRINRDPAGAVPASRAPVEPQWSLRRPDDAGAA